MESSLGRTKPKPKVHSQKRFHMSYCLICCRTLKDVIVTSPTDTAHKELPMVNAILHLLFRERDYCDRMPEYPRFSRHNWISQSNAVGDPMAVQATVIGLKVGASALLSL